MKYLLTIILIFFTTNAFAIDLQIIKHLESRGNPFAISNKGCIGHFQVSGAALKDFNKANKTHYAKRDLFIPSVNKRVALWYFRRIRQMLRYYKLPNTLLYKLACWNWGIGRVKKWSGLFKHLPYETQRFCVNYVKRL